MDLTASTYVAALTSGDLVGEIVSPRSVSELVEALRGGPAVVIGRGGSGVRRPSSRSTLISLTELGGHATVDPISVSITVPGWWTWAQAETAARDDGLTLGSLVDTYPERSVGATLSMHPMLPPLWMSNTARAACVGLEAVSVDGAHYKHIVSPRTASGPDLRAVFLGAEGGAGAIVRVTLRAERAGTVRWYEGGPRPELQRLLNEFGSILGVRGADGRALLRVRSGTRFARRLESLLSSLGYEDSSPAVPAPPPAVICSVPWEAFPEMAGEPSLEFAAAGPTHVAFGAGAEGLTALETEFASRPLHRVIRHNPEAFE